jgi:hypothetical protein
MTEGNKAYNLIKEKLHTLRQKEKSIKLLSGFLLSAAIIMLLGLILAALEASFWFPPTVRILLVSVFLSLGIIALIRWMGSPLFSLMFRKETPHDDTLALRVGDSYPHIKDRLTDSLQVFRARQIESYGTSAALAEESLNAVRRNVESLNFNSVISKTNLFRWTRRFFFIMSITAGTLLLFTKSMGDALTRLSHPRTPFQRTVPYQITLYPGEMRVIQGEDVDISAEVKGALSDELRLFISDENGTVVEHILESPYIHRIPAIRTSVEYYAETDKIRTPSYRIEVVRRPMVRMLRVKQFPPSYAKQGTIIQEPNSGEIEALKGTRVEVSVTANKKLATAALLFEGREKKALTVRDREAAETFIVQKDDRYRIELTDTLGLMNENPISYAVHCLPDFHPMARILFPAKNVDLDEEMILPLTLEAEDDYGLSMARLGYRIYRGGKGDSLEIPVSYISLTLEQNEPRRTVLNHTWQMEGLELFPEDVISYYLEVFDNDRISGPKSARSKAYTARFPSISEIFREVEAEQTSQTEALTEIFNESRTLQEDLKRISDDMKGGKKPEWEDRKNIESMTENQRHMTERVENLRQRLDELVQRLEHNDLLSMETLTKYQELQKLYRDISSPELQEAMKKLQETMDQVSQDAFKQSLDNFQMSQENFLKSIERTISLLKRLRIEQKTDELVKRAEDLLARQEEINRQLADETDKNLSGLAEQENDVAKDTEALRQEMEELHKMMEELTDMPVSQLEASMQMMEQRNLLGRLSNAENAMKDGNRGRAAGEGKQAQQTMNDLAEMLKEMQQNLQSNQKQQVVNALKRASFRLLRLSRGQEALMAGTQGGKMSGSQAAQQQMSLLQGLSQVADSLVQLSKQTFFVTPDMGKALGDAQSQMQQALRQMEQAAGRGAEQRQGRAMGALNQTVLAIQDAMNKAVGASSGLGMDQFMHQLEQMAGQQMGINQQTLELSQKGRLSLAEQAAMSRLASEQAALKKAMEDLLREFGNRSEITGRLDRMAEDMEEVVRDLRQQNASPETIRRQERILSRLLDAQHSIRQRDYSRQRQAITGEDVVRQSPGPLQEVKSDWRDRLRRDLLRLTEEGYTQDYQELIRQYFEALVREEKK